MLQRIATDVADAATVESFPAFDGRSMIMIMTAVTEQ
jgi:translation initiation factor IF-3